MKFLHYDLGFLDSGAVVIVTLDAQANVQLLDDTNLYAYRNGRRYTYYGGLATESPVRIGVPHAGNWHVAVDLGGYAGTVNASVRVAA